jgi:hypothetical protein
MLQWATGQGVIVVSTRPNISTNILANTSTKITFRLPYDSAVGGRFMSIDEEQEQYLRTLKRGRALILMPYLDTFEIATMPFSLSDHIISSASRSEASTESAVEIDVLGSRKKDTEIEHEEEPAHVLEVGAKHSACPEGNTFNKLGKLANHLVAFLAPRDLTTENDIHEFLQSLDPRITEQDIAEVIRDLISLSTIQREAIPLVPGGSVFTPPGKGLDAVRSVIISYIAKQLGSECQVSQDKNEIVPDIIIEDRAIMVVPEHLRTSTIPGILERIKLQMETLGTGTTELVIIVRGSVAASKLREIIDQSEEFDAVSVVSAFPASIDKMIANWKLGLVRERTELELAADDPEFDKVDLIEAVHDVGAAPSRAVQMRLWFGLIQDFVDLSKGIVAWNDVLEFIDTTALQSRKGRSAPMNIEEGKRALTELLADEALIAVRVGNENGLVELDEGLWVVNTSVLKDIKLQAVEHLEKELAKKHNKVSREHTYYDLCVDGKSFAVFPTQQELSTLLRLHSDVACRICGSTAVVCILTAAEYLDDSVKTPSNLVLKTLDDGVSTITA